MNSTFIFIGHFIEHTSTQTDIGSHLHQFAVVDLVLSELYLRMRCCCVSMCGIGLKIPPKAISSKQERRKIPVVLMIDHSKEDRRPEGLLRQQAQGGNNLSDVLTVPAGKRVSDPPVCIYEKNGWKTRQSELGAEFLFGIHQHITREAVLREK